MKKIEAIIKPFKLDDLKDRLRQVGAQGMTVSEVRGFGRTGGKKEVYRGSAYVVDFIPKVRIQIVVDDDLVQPIVEAILATARTGEIGTARSSSVPSPTPSASAPASTAATPVARDLNDGRQGAASRLARLDHASVARIGPAHASRGNLPPHEEHRAIQGRIISGVVACAGLCLAVSPAARAQAAPPAAAPPAAAPPKAASSGDALVAPQMRRLRCSRTASLCGAPA